MEIHRGDIVYIEKRNDTIGHEQYSGRPAVVVSNDKGNMSSRSMIYLLMSKSEVSGDSVQRYVNRSGPYPRSGSGI